VFERLFLAREKAQFHLLLIFVFLAAVMAVPTMALQLHGMTATTVGYGSGDLRQGEVQKAETHPEHHASSSQPEARICTPTGSCFGCHACLEVDIAAQVDAIPMQAADKHYFEQPSTRFVTAAHPPALKPPIL
jgi:hypothetical protein